MEGIIFVAGLLAVVTAAGISKQRSSSTPGVLLTLAIVAGSAWYVFA